MRKRLISRAAWTMNPRRGRCADEQGSVVIVVIVIVLVSVGITTLLATVQSSQRAGQTDDERTAAFQRANGGIDHALYRFDRSGGLLGASNSPLPSMEVGNYDPVLNSLGGLESFTDSVTVPGEGTYTITATADPPDCNLNPALVPPDCIQGGQTTQYRVQAVGRDATGRERQAVATISAEPLFRNGFFTEHDFTLTGNQTTPVAYRSAVNPCPWGPNEPEGSGVCSPPYSGFYGPWPPAEPIDGSIGTNGTIAGAQQTIRTFALRWQSFNMYGRATQEAADQACAEGECSDEGGTVVPFTDRREDYMPDIPDDAQACPNGGVITPTQSPLLPGDYTCPILSFQGTVNVATTGGDGSGRVRIWPTSRLRFSSGSVVNRLQVPANLQIYFAEPSDPGSNDSTICRAEVWALLYTPGLNIACNGSHQPKIFGAVVARLHGGTGNQFNFHWDLSSQLTVHNGEYKILNWRECPVGSVC